jgi:hypothetical protein
LLCSGGKIMTKHQRILLIILFSTATSYAGESPSSGNGGLKTTLTLLNKSPGVTASATLFDSDLDCMGIHVSALEKSWVEKKFEVTQRAFQTFGFQYLGVGSGGGGLVSKSCTATYTFATEPGVAYVIELGKTAGGCEIQVSHLDTEGKPVQSELFRRESTTPLFKRAGPWCVADSRFAVTR